MTPEYLVYRELIAYLAPAWTVICASPPGGTDLRFARCHLPRAGDRGARDEVDITVIRDGLCLLIECKASVRASIQVRNEAGESDVEKLERLRLSWPPSSLRHILERVHGSGTPEIMEVRTAIAVAVEDMSWRGLIDTVFVADARGVRGHSVDLQMVARLQHGGSSDSSVVGPPGSGAGGGGQDA